MADPAGVSSSRGRSPRRWLEPTAAIPLRWGRYRSRLYGGLLLLVAGGLAIAGGSGTTFWAALLLYLGSAAHILGWAVLPSRGWRRVVAIGPSTFAMWFLLTGPQWLAVLVLPYLAWLLVRHRPLASYPTALFVLAGGIMAARLTTSYSDMLVALAAEGGVLVLSAWAARAVHEAAPRVRRGRKSSIPQE